jgi:hypothetical protein
MNFGIQHILDWRAGAAAIVFLFWLSLKNLSGQPTGGGRRKAQVKRADKRKH